MVLLKAIEKVLAAAGKPLHVDQITHLVLSGSLWKTSGKTPAATISACLYSDIKKNAAKSLFIKTSPVTFALRDRVAFDNTDKTRVPEPSETPRLEATPTVSGFSFAVCAQKVLEESGKKEPMHYRKITAKALAKGWLVTAGKTPESTMYAQIITKIKNQEKRGERPLFVQHGRGKIGLRDWQKTGLAAQIEQHNRKVRDALLKKLLAMKPEEFEKLISQLLTAMGFEEVDVTKLSRDGGIDVRGTLVVGDVIRTKIAIQAKKWKLGNNVQTPTVQQVRGSLGVHEQGLIITTSKFSRGAQREAVEKDKTPIALMNGEQLVMLLMEHRIGVHRSTPALFEIGGEPLAGEEESDEK